MSACLLGGQRADEETHHGVYQLNQDAVTFTGKDKIEVKRRALDYWYRKPRHDGRSLRAFLSRCRLSADGRRIVFHPWKPRIA